MKFHINTPQTCPRCGGSSGTQSIQFTEIRQSVPVEELPPARVPGLGPGSGGLTVANGLWVIVSTSWLLLRPPHHLPHMGEATFTLLPPEIYRKSKTIIRIRYDSMHRKSV